MTGWEDVQGNILSQKLRGGTE